MFQQLQANNIYIFFILRWNMAFLTGYVRSTKYYQISWMPLLPCSQAHVFPPSPCRSVEAGPSGIHEETLEVDPHLQKVGNPTHEAWMGSPTGTTKQKRRTNYHCGLFRSISLRRSKELNQAWLELKLLRNYFGNLWECFGSIFGITPAVLHQLQQNKW